MLAWLLLLLCAALWQSVIDVTTGAVQAPADILPILDIYVHRLAAISFLSICSLWLIKASFLSFFYKLGNNVQGHKVFWWTAMVASSTGLAITIGVQNYKCIIGPAAGFPRKMIPYKR